MKKNIKVRNIIVKTSADMFTPVALMFGFYVILHGHITPGGGFQGGVLVASAAILLYLGYGYDTAIKAIKPDVIRKNEALGAICYTGFALIGLAFGANFCRNIFSDIGKSGELISSGTIMFMNYAVGYKVLTGVAFLVLLMLGLLAPEEKHDKR